MKIKIANYLIIIGLALVCGTILVRINQVDKELYGPNKNTQRSVPTEVLSEAHTLNNIGSEAQAPSTRIYAKVSRYSKIETCPNRACVTSSGTVATPNRTIACPRKYKHFTKVEIAGHIYTCEDRTALRYDGRFDIYEGDTLADYQRAIELGLQTLEVKIYDVQ